MAREISFTRTIHPIDMEEIKFKFYNSGMVTVSDKDGEHEIAMYKKCPFISSRRERVMSLNSGYFYQTKTFATGSKWLTHYDVKEMVNSLFNHYYYERKAKERNC